MKQFVLSRFLQNDNGTFGMICYKGAPLMATYELPWKNNYPNISCIPTGTYTAALIQAPKHGQVYEIQDVQGRDAILFHVGNTALDTNGCILVGTEHGTIYLPSGNKPGVLGSKNAFQRFMRACLPDNAIQINIIGSENVA
jgi:hypothetical protein